MSETENDINAETLISLLEHCVSMHQYFLDWRHRLLAGYIFIISAIYYFIFTWAQKPANFSFDYYFIICFVGILITILFYLMHFRITRLIWKCQNSAYLVEKDLGFTNEGRYVHSKLGLYGNIVDKRIRGWLDKGIYDFEKIPFGLCKEELNPIRHRGAINWVFIFVIGTFIYLFFQYSTLEVQKNNWLEKQNKLYELQISSVNNQNLISQPFVDSISIQQDSLAAKTNVNR